MIIQQSSIQSRTFRISRDKFHAKLLSAALVLTFLLPSLIYSTLFILVLLAYLLPKSGKIDSKTSRVLMPLYCMALLGIFYSFNNTPVDIVRDVWHIGKALSCLILGYLLARRVRRTSLLLKEFIIVSLILSILYIAPYLLGTRVIGLERPSDAMNISMATAIALPLLLIRRNGLIWIRSTYFRFVTITVILLAYGLSLSRTAVGCAVIIILSSLGFFDSKKRLLLYVILLGLLAFLVVQLLPSIESGDITFTSKIRNSLAEITFTDGSDPSAMLINWRGFEAYRAYISFANSNLIQQLVGRGFGATVDLGMPIQMTDDMNFQFIPVLHNGYMHILAKYGLLGILFYLVFLRRIGTLSGHGHANLRRILIALSLILAYTTLVITGIFNKENLDSILIMLGVFLGIAEQKRRFAKKNPITTKPMVSVGQIKNAI